MWSIAARAAAKPWTSVLGRIAALACAGLALFGFIAFYFVRKNYGYTFSPINHSLAYLSITIAIVYVFFGVRALLDHYSLRDVFEIIKTLGWGRLLIAAAIFLGIGKLTSFFGQPNPDYLQAGLLMWYFSAQLSSLHC